MAYKKVLDELAEQYKLQAEASHTRAIRSIKDEQERQAKLKLRAVKEELEKKGELPSSSQVIKFFEHVEFMEEPEPACYCFSRFYYPPRGPSYLKFKTIPRTAPPADWAQFATECAQDLSKSDFLSAKTRLLLRAPMEEQRLAISKVQAPLRGPSGRGEHDASHAVLALHIDVISYFWGVAKSEVMHEMLSNKEFLGLSDVFDRAAKNSGSIPALKQALQRARKTFFYSSPRDNWDLTSGRGALAGLRPMDNRTLQQHIIRNAEGRFSLKASMGGTR